MRYSELTANIVSSGVYLDFEGFSNEEPVVAGRYVDGIFAQVAFDKRFELACATKKIPMVNLRSWLTQLVDWALAESRMILAFSNHERDLIEQFVGVLPEGSYGNLLPTAREWRRRQYSEEHDRVAKRRRRKREKGHYVGGIGNRFIDFCKAAGILVPRTYAHGHTTRRLSTVREQLLRRGTYEGLTPVAKGKWTKLLDHNRFDCRGLELLSQTMMNSKTQAAVDQQK